MNLQANDIDEIKKQLDQLKIALALCKDLLDPEMYGHAVTAEVRNRARDVFGIKTMEPL